MRPTTPPPRWATTTVTEPIEINGNVILVTNSVEPTEEFKNTGYLARQPYVRPYDNWILNDICKWIEYLADNVAVGDFKVMSTTTTDEDMVERFGGVWTDHGVDTLAGQSVRLFERVA